MYVYKIHILPSTSSCSFSFYFSIQETIRACVCVCVWAVCYARMCISVFVPATHKEEREKYLCVIINARVDTYIRLCLDAAKILLFVAVAVAARCGDL